MEVKLTPIDGGGLSGYPAKLRRIAEDLALNHGYDAPQRLLAIADDLEHLDTMYKARETLRKRS